MRNDVCQVFLMIQVDFWRKKRETNKRFAREACKWNKPKKQQPRMDGKTPQTLCSNKI